MDKKLYTIDFYHMEMQQHASNWWVMLFDTKDGRGYHISLGLGHGHIEEIYQIPLLDNKSIGSQYGKTENKNRFVRNKNRKVHWAMETFQCELTPHMCGGVPYLMQDK